MKRKRADRQDWQRVTKRRFAMKRLEANDFVGYVSLFCIDDVHEPLHIKFSGQEVCLADKGYMWLQHFPHGKHHTVTSVFDAQGELVRWYIDICKQHYFDENGVLWYEDLYLDVDVSLAGETTLLDADELDEALLLGKISSLEYDLAWREADSILTAIEQDLFPLLWTCEIHKDELLRVAS